MATSSPTTLYQQFNAARAARDAAAAAHRNAEALYEARRRRPSGAWILPAETAQAALEDYSARVKAQQEQIDQENRDNWRGLRVDELKRARDRAVIAADDAYRAVIAAPAKSLGDVKMKLTHMLGDGYEFADVDDLALITRDIEVLLRRAAQ